MWYRKWGSGTLWVSQSQSVSLKKAISSLGQNLLLTVLSFFLSLSHPPTLFPFAFLASSISSEKMLLSCSAEWFGCITPSCPLFHISLFLTCNLLLCPEDEHTGSSTKLHWITPYKITILKQKVFLWIMHIRWYDRMKLKGSIL